MAILDSSGCITLINIFFAIMGKSFHTKESRFPGRDVRDPKIQYIAEWSKFFSLYEQWKVDFGVVLLGARRNIAFSSHEQADCIMPIRKLRMRN
jgi:hypothetical protein